MGMKMSLLSLKFRYNIDYSESITRTKPLLGFYKTLTMNLKCSTIDVAKINVCTFFMIS